MTELLFDTPWWLPVAVLIAGVVVFVAGNKRVEARVRFAGVLIVALGIGLAALSYLVDTPMERAENRSRELIQAFEGSDWNRMSSILDANTAVTVLSQTIYKDRNEIVAGAKKVHERYRFKQVRVLSTTPAQTQTEITITMGLLSEQDSLASVLNSEWQFEWRQSAEGWFLYEIRALKIGQSTGDNAAGLFPK